MLPAGPASAFSAGAVCLPLLSPTVSSTGCLRPCSPAPLTWFQVVFGKKLPTFATIPLHQLQHEKKYDIYFADGKVFALYRCERSLARDSEGLWPALH